jgi:hypothetical protein
MRRSFNNWKHSSEAFGVLTSAGRVDSILWGIRRQTGRALLIEVLVAWCQAQVCTKQIIVS